MRHAVDAGAPAIVGDIGLVGREPQRRAVEAGEAAVIPDVRQPPMHALIGEIGERMAERRQLPVEHGEQARRVSAKIILSMRKSPWTSDTRPSSGGMFAASQSIRRFMSGDCRGFAGAVLLAPALRLPREIIAGLAVVGEADLGDVDRVQLRQARVHRVVDAGALFARRVGQPGSQKMRPSTWAIR